MKKTKLTRSLLAACSIVALSAVMYGCTSDGSKDELVATQEDLAQEREAHAVTEAERDAARDERDAAQDNADDLQTQLTAATGNAADLQTQLTAATGNADDLQTQLTAATGNADDLQMQLDTATGNADDLQMQLDTATGNADDLQMQLDTATADLGTANAETMRIQGELDAANGEVDQLTTDLGDANGQVAQLTTDLGDANGQVAQLTTDLGDANGQVGQLTTDLATANGQVGQLTTDLATANGQVAQLTTDLATANDEADDLRADLDAIQNPVDADPVKTTAAGTKAEAIGDEAAQSVDAGLGGDDALVDEDAAATYSVTINADGTEVEVKDSALAGNNDPKFEQAMDFGDGRTMHVRAMAADDDGNVVEEVVIVSTDIKPPKATPFAMVAGQALDTRDLDTNEDANGDGDAINDYTALIVPDDELDVPGLVMAGAFTSSGRTMATLSFTFAQDDSDDDAPGRQSVKAFETAGTYNGAMGTYRCNGDAVCTVTVDADNMLTDVSPGWIFTPNTGATSNVDDTDYLTYGFWLQRTTDEDGVLTYDEVETFAMATGILETADDNLSGVVGAATYSGGAVGVYVKNVLDDQAAVVSATSGHFSADAELNASFGGGGVAANDQFTIGGTITDFALQHGEENDWTVKLDLADFGGRAEGADPGESPPGDAGHMNTFSGDATGDNTAVDGSWNGSFWGSSEPVDHDMDETTDNISPQPVAVIGEFNANFRDGTTAGAFGANKE